MTTLSSLKRQRRADLMRALAARIRRERERGDMVAAGVALANWAEIATPAEFKRRPAYMRGLQTY